MNRLQHSMLTGSALQHKKKWGFTNGIPNGKRKAEDKIEEKVIKEKTIAEKFVQGKPQASDADRAKNKATIDKILGKVFQGNVSGFPDAPASYNREISDRKNGTYHVSFPEFEISYLIDAPNPATARAKIYRIDKALARLEEFEKNINKQE